jgi:hypothetical protein
MISENQNKADAFLGVQRREYSIKTKKWQKRVRFSQK